MLYMGNRFADTLLTGRLKRASIKHVLNMFKKKGTAIGEPRQAALLTAAAALLRESEHPERVTSREIAARAGGNAAMINYYYGSKEKLMARAVEKILDEAAAVFHQPPDPTVLPKERLRRVMLHIGRTVLKYRRYTRVYVPHMLLEEEIRLPEYILPELREHFGKQRSEAECRVIAYEMVSFLQLAFYRSDAFLRYSGIDLSDERACGRLIDWELEQFLKEGPSV